MKMIKQRIFASAISLVFATNVFCFGDLIKNTDYFVAFKDKSPEMAAVLHVNFVNSMPEPKTAEDIVKQQLRIYASRLKPSGKNIIGSAWYVNKSDIANPVKIKFQKDLGAYVWICSTRSIVTFPNYINFLKKTKIGKKVKISSGKQPT